MLSAVFGLFGGFNIGLAHDNMMLGGGGGGGGGGVVRWRGYLWSI